MNAGEVRFREYQMLIDHDSVYFSVVTSETGRATRFCDNLKAAADLVQQIVLA